MASFFVLATGEVDLKRKLSFPARVQTLRDVMEAVMLQNPRYWLKYYPGTPQEQHLQRHFSYSDRIRYYWTDPDAEAAVAELMARFDGLAVPETLISQFFGRAYGDVMAGLLAPTAGALLSDAVSRLLVASHAACRDRPRD